MVPGGGRPASRGMTLLEMMLVISILGLMLGVVVPIFHRTLVQLQLNGSAQQLAADLRHWQQRAISEENSGLKVLINTQPPNYYYLLKENSVISKQVVLTDKVAELTTNFTGNGFTFTLRGTPHTGGGFIRLMDRYGRERYVIITPVTGRVRVSSTPPAS